MVSFSKMGVCPTRIYISGCYFNIKRKQLYGESGFFDFFNIGSAVIEDKKLTKLKGYGKILLPKKEKEAFKPPSDGTTIHLQINANTFKLD